MTPAAARAETGTLGGSHSYVRVGDGPQILIVLPGLTLDNATPSGRIARGYRYAFHRLAEGRTLYIVQRRRGLPARAGTRDIAADYARLFGEEFGRVSVMGLSTGGLVAQHLALDSPELVERLALVVTGDRIAPAGREICQRWRGLAATEDWRGLRGSLTATAMDGATAQRIASFLVSRLGSGKAPATEDIRDFATTVDAVLAHDTSRLLGGVKVPTLLIGGSDDPFFPTATLQETAKAIPGCHLIVYEGSGHGAPKQSARRLQADVDEFLTIGAPR